MSHTKEASKGEFLTIPQVAKELAISARSVWRLIEKQQLARYQFGASTRIRREDLEKFIARCREA